LQLFASLQGSDDDAVTPEQRRKKIRRKPRVATNDFSEEVDIVSGDRRSEMDREVLLVDETSVATTITAPVQLQPKAAETVIQVMDVRSLVAGAPAVSDRTTIETVPFLVSDGRRNRSTPPSSQPFDDMASTTSTIANLEDDPLAQILQDVKEMRATESRTEPAEGNLSVSKILSTIVIADFFVVMILFFWFLLGIFSSYVVHDDAIQIAFNGIFQPIVQPALGLLMIASISDAVLKKDE
jgi:hypothetical protein